MMTKRSDQGDCGFQLPVEMLSSLLRILKIKMDNMKAGRASNVLQADCSISFGGGS